MLVRFDPFSDAENRVQLFNRQMSAPPLVVSMDACRNGDRYLDCSISLESILGPSTS